MAAATTTTTAMTTVTAMAMTTITDITMVTATAMTTATAMAMATAITTVMAMAAYLREATNGPMQTEILLCWEPYLFPYKHSSRNHEFLPGVGR